MLYYKCDKPRHNVDEFQSKINENQQVINKSTSANESKSTDQESKTEQRSDGSMKPSGSKKSSTCKRRVKVAEVAKATTLLILQTYQIVDMLLTSLWFPTEICINAAVSNDCNSYQNACAVSLDCLANHSFGFCKSIMTDLKKNNFTVTGANNGTSKGTPIYNTPCFGPVTKMVSRCEKCILDIESIDFSAIFSSACD